MSEENTYKRTERNHTDPKKTKHTPVRHDVVAKKNQNNRNDQSKKNEQTKQNEQNEQTNRRVNPRANKTPGRERPQYIKPQRQPVSVEDLALLQKKISFPPELPVTAEVDKIAELIQNNQVVIICGETGSGKTTQLPKICMSLGRGWGAGGTGMIGHTQPRRLAATSTANRIAQELQSNLGDIVGYKIRFNDRLHDTASIKLMTDGILLAETQSDRMLSQYDTIIIDEAHERSLNIDFLMGYIKQILPKRPDFKLIITSATIDAERFAQHFSHNDIPAPIINVSGRTYPVEVRYRAVQETQQDKDNQRDIYDAIVEATEELSFEPFGDVLVFLPGEREIREAAEALRKRHPAHTEILALFSRLSQTDQEKIFKPSNARRIILATNVAETSLTVPGIRYVIDTGLARVKRYSFRQKVEQLMIEPISKASANQRSGRCGRVAAGICIRLYDEAEFLGRPDFADPEILRSSLANVILQMKSLGLTDIELFPFVQAPLNRAVVDGYQLLKELGAIDEQHKITNIGRTIAKLPIDPKVARMIIAANELGALKELLIIASALSIQDPRDRPTEFRQQADSAHQKFNHEQSEFMSYLKLWDWYHNELEHKKSNRKLQDHCRENFLNNLRLREWRDVHSQLMSMVKQQGWRLNETEATYEQLHLSLLTGLLGHIGYKNDKAQQSTSHQKSPQKNEKPVGDYLGARGNQFILWPATTVSKRKLQWLMAAEMVQTSKLFARGVAQIQPEWIEKMAPDLLQKSYGEPKWYKRQGQVKALERATLYGLVIYRDRAVSYSKIDPKLSRDIFIRDGVATHEIEGDFPFVQHNARLISEIEKIEHKSRRQDVLVDDELIVAFYESKVPADICDIRTFKAWYEAELKLQPDLLKLSKEALMQHEADGVTTALFPKWMEIGGHRCACSYHFEPGAARDGLTVAVPIVMLNFVSPVAAQWLVPGMLKDKVQAYLKSLPQKIRKHCVPIPEFAEDFIAWSEQQQLTGRKPMLDALIQFIRLEASQHVLLTDFKDEQIPLHFHMNFKLLDEHGRQVEMSRNLSLLKNHFGQEARSGFQEIVKSQTQNAPTVPQIDFASKTHQATSTSKTDAQKQFAQEKMTTWNIEPLPELMALNIGGQSFFGYPALQDQGDGCVLTVWDDESLAKSTHRQGLLRLLMLALASSLKDLEKSIPNQQALGMHCVALFNSNVKDLCQEIISASLLRAAHLDQVEQWPRDAQAFQSLVSQVRTRMGLIVQELSRLVLNIFEHWQAVKKKLTGLKNHAGIYKDMAEQLEQMLPKGFISQTDYEHFQHFPRYLKGMEIRCDKIKNGSLERDQQMMRDMLPLLTNYQRVYKQSMHDVLPNPKLGEFRWMLEELRVGLFAQELRTPMPVSVKRLQKYWQSII